MKIETKITETVTLSKVDLLRKKRNGLMKQVNGLNKLIAKFEETQCEDLMAQADEVLGE